MRPVIALLWGKPGGPMVGDFAERGAVQRGENAPMRDVRGQPMLHLTADVVPWSPDPHPPKRRHDDPGVWSTRQQTEPRCWKCSSVMRLKWRRRLSRLLAEFWCIGCGGKVRGSGRTEEKAREDVARRLSGIIRQRGDR